MNRGVIDQSDFKLIFSKTMEKFEIDDHDLNQKEVYSQFIREINDAIRFYSFEIQKGVCEISGITFYCFIRQFDACSIGKLSAIYSPTELKIFQIILPMIIESPRGYVSYNEIVDSTNDAFDEISAQAQTQTQKISKPLSNRDIRATVDMFISHYWLMELVNNTNMVTLHGRALIELQQYFKEVFDEEQLKSCFRCKKLLLIGLTCGGCNQNYHRSCAKEIFSNHNACTNCKAVFPETEILELRETLSEAKSAYNRKYKNL